jgi:CelD/BcsL family acetyltransferase involved in cellulose biosynthesis
LFSRALNCPLLFQFLKELSRSGGPQDRLVTSLLTAGGRPISWDIGLRFKDRHCGFITAHDTSLTDCSPARLHMDLAQRRAIADGMKTFDLMVPNDPHKESWSSGAMPVHDFYAPVSALGQLYGRVYLSGLRPVLRYAYYNAPPSLRPLLTAAVKLKLKASGPR